MFRNARKTMAAFLSVSLVAVSIVGCGSKSTDTPTPGGNSTSNDKGTPGTAFTYPMKNAAKIRVWTNNQASNVCTSYDELPWYQESVKKTGIQVEWVHPASNSGDLFNMMLASGDIPDVILNQWNNFKGGPQKAIDDGIILAYNDILDKYMPNLKKFFQSDPEMEKMCKTDDGNYYLIPHVRNAIDAKYPGTIYQGPIVRKDWLDDLGLKVPETLDDWTNMLRAFKDKKGATAPLTMQKNVPFANAAFIGSYGILYGYYQDNGKVKFGPVEPEYKEFLTLMNKWYTEGLLDAEYGKVDQKNEQAKIYSGQSGASFGLLTGQLQTWNNAMKEQDPKFKVIGVAQPKVSKSSTKPVINAYSSRLGTYPAGISATSKNVETAARWLDWAFTEDGTLTYCFGVPGTSYNMVNGKPQLIADVWAKTDNRYYYSWWNGPYIMGNDIKEEQLKTKEDLDTIKIWTTDAEKYYMPNAMNFTEQENAEMNDIKTEIDNYVKSMYLKFVTGAEPLNKYDEYVAQVKKLGLETVLKIQQASLDRYNKR